LFTPAVGMGGTLKFDAWQRSASYPDKIMVYVCDNPDWESVDEFVPVSEFIQPAGTTATNYEIDLSEYEGMGVIAFRHYDCNDQWSIYIDNIAVEIPGAQEPAEWTLVENAAKVDGASYTIEGLMPDTKYEAQVMAIGPDGRTTNWTESVEFTTVAEDPSAISTVGVDKTDNVYYNLLGVKFNGMPTTPGIYINNGKKVIIK
ncbi:MAG: fibronectin type III domain-containing protein, partial [Muribaculaceae bacterium]|nr:fibronectin type III domain-containing protein [Muribaculaceae bacterium]